MCKEMDDDESGDDSNKINSPESHYLFMGLSQIPASGNGLYTAINIYKDEIIASFRGHIITQAQAKFRAVRGNDKYFINLLDGSIMDSMQVKCFAKYANDANGFSVSSFRNNSKIALDENDNVCLIARVNIKAGEELFCSYGKKYWKKHG